MPPAYNQTPVNVEGLFQITEVLNTVYHYFNISKKHLSKQEAFEECFHASEWFSSSWNKICWTEQVPSKAEATGFNFCGIWETPYPHSMQGVVWCCQMNGCSDKEMQARLTD